MLLEAGVTTRPQLLPACSPPTCSCIMDMANTLQAVVSASNLPLSLLIVGVGDEDFAAMEVRPGLQLRASGMPGAAECLGWWVNRQAGKYLTVDLLAMHPGAGFGQEAAAGAQRPAGGARCCAVLRAAPARGMPRERA